MVLNRKSKSTLETGLCLGILALLALLALSPMLRGKVPAAGQGILFEAPWEEARPPGLPSPIQDDTQLQTSRFYPWYVYLHHAAHSNDSILWNPLEGCGMPFMAQWRTRCFSPFSLPFYVFPIGAALGLSAFLKLFVAGCCAFHAAKRLGFGSPLALTTGVAFEFSGHALLWMGWPLSDVVPWFPLMLLYVERLLVEHHRYWPWGAIVVALMAFGGDPETLGAALIFALLYALVRNLMDGKPLRTTARVILILAFSTAMGLAAAAVQIIPFIEFVKQAVETNPAHPTALTLRDIVVAFLPHFPGDPAAIAAQGDTVRANRVVMLLHFGFVQLWLLPLWFSVRSFVLDEQRRRTESLLVVVAAMTVLAFVFGRSAGGIPLLRYLRPEHLLMANSLSLALVSITAAEEWLALNVEQCKRSLKRLAAWSGVFLTLCVAATIAGKGLPRVDSPPIWSQLLTAAALLVALMFVLGVTLLRPKPWYMGAGLTALTFVCALVAFRPGVTFVPNESLYPETPFIQTLSDISERIGGSEPLKRWALAGNSIPQVYCPSALPPDGVVLERYEAFAGRIKDDPLLLRRTGAAALLLGKEDIRGAFAPIRPNLAIRHVFPSGAVLFKDLDAKPRAWVAYDWRSGHSLDAEAINSTKPPFVEGAPASGGNKDAADGKVLLASDTGSTRTEIEIDSPLPGMLVLSDAFYPGWKAVVNDEEARILPVDGMFRGIPIKEGKQKVVFSYAPSSLRFGIGTSTVAGLAILFALRRVIRHRIETKQQALS